MVRNSQTLSPKYTQILTLIDTKGVQKRISIFGCNSPTILAMHSINGSKISPFPH